MQRRKILICSSSFDEHTHGPVHEHLLRNRHKVVTYHVDRVMNGSERLLVRLGSDRSLEIRYNDEPIGPDAIDAAWHWKVANFAVPDAEANLSKQLTLVNEITHYNNSLWSLYPERLWLSAPWRIQWAERKLIELQVAQRLGFAVPTTLISNEWAEVEKFHAEHGGEGVDCRTSGDIVVKMFRGVIGDQNRVKAMYTTVLDAELIADLSNRTFAFPGMFQPFVDKAREWRVTVVGEDVFAGAIHADDEARNDWRQMQSTAAVAFRAEPFDEATADLCRAYLREFALGIGSFDFVETTDGQLVFLECNPSGQFRFLEELLDLPISRSVADHLIRVANGLD